VGTKWLPLEPQDDSNLNLSKARYFPTSIYAEYEAQVGQEIGVGELLRRYGEFDGFVFEKN
jgi:hypothetical protein